MPLLLASIGIHAFTQWLTVNTQQSSPPEVSHSRMPNQRRQPQATTSTTTYIAAKLPCINTLCSSTAFREQMDTTNYLLKHILGGILRADSSAFLEPMRSSNTLQCSTLNWKYIENNRIRIPTVKAFFQGFFIPTDGPTKKGYIECRICLCHTQPVDNILDSILALTSKSELPCSFSVDPIQATDIAPIGWLMGSYTPSINLPALTKAIKQQVPTHLELTLVNQNIQYFDDPADNNFPQATHIWGSKTQKQELQLLLLEVYPLEEDKPLMNLPLQRPYRFVPSYSLTHEILTVELKKKLCGLLAKQVSVANHYRTIETDSIVALDLSLAPGTPTCREALMTLSIPDSTKPLFLAVDHKVTDPSKVVLTFHKDNLDTAVNILQGLPLLMASKLGSQAFTQWFTAPAQAEAQKVILQHLASSSLGNSPNWHQLQQTLAHRNNIEWYNTVIRQQATNFNWPQPSFPPGFQHPQGLRWVTALVLKHYQVAWDMWQFHIHIGHDI